MYFKDYLPNHILKLKDSKYSDKRVASFFMNNIMRGENKRILYLAT